MYKLSRITAQQLESFLKFLKNNEGLHEQLDEKISVIYEHRKFLENMVNDESLPYSMDRGISDKLVLLIDRFRSYKQNPEDTKARAFLQSVTSNLVSSIPTDSNPFVLLSNMNNLLDFRIENGNVYFVEIAYFEERYIGGCSGLNHEVGHSLFKEYILQDGKPQEFLGKIDPLMRKLFKKNKSRKVWDSIGGWLLSWLAEFTADAFSVRTLGIGGLASVINEIKRLNRPAFFGSDSHPPDNLRIQFMRDMLMKVVRRQEIESPCLRVIEDWSASGRNQMPTEAFVKSALNDPQFNREEVQKYIDQGRMSNIPNKVAFNRQVLKFIYSYIERILDWGEINHDYSSILRAREELLKGNIPEEPIQNTFAAMVEISQSKENTDLEELLRTTVEDI